MENEEAKQGWKPSAGWYPNPEDRRQQRYWDGERWTDQTRNLTIFDRVARAGYQPGPGSPQFAVTPLATGLVITGSALTGLSMALPAVDAPGLLGGTPVENDNLYGLVPAPIFLISAAIYAAWAGFRAHRDNLRVWAPIVVGGLVLAAAIAFGSSDQARTLHPIDVGSGEPDTSARGVVGDAAAGVFVLGAGGALLLLGGLLIRSSRPLGDSPRVSDGAQEGGVSTESAAAEPTTKRCPDCAEAVLEGARVCRYCGYRFEASETEGKIP